jgi:uncharacterized protein (DUF885 family)
MVRLFVFGLLLSLAGCALKQHTPGGSGADAAFETLSQEYLSGYLSWHPQAGTQAGLHEYDGRIRDLSRAAIRRELGRLKSFEGRLASLPVSELSPVCAYDYRILQATIQKQVFTFENLRAFERNPMVYPGELGVDIYIKRDFAPLQQRLRSVQKILAQAPQLFANAHANLETNLPRPQVEVAIEMANGLADFLEKDLTLAVRDLANSEFNSVRDRAALELREYAAWLKRERLPVATASYALGASNYARLLLVGEFIDSSPDALLQLGMNELRKTQAAFAETARIIEPGQTAIEVFKAIQKDHPTPESLIPDTARNLESIRQFLVDRNLITLPSEVRATVKETPQFLRATSFASMDTPGPFERKATEAYYYVTPVEKEWSAAQKEEWLTAFNFYTTDVVSIHEAYPGHYTQYLCLNASRASRLEKLFPSYAFVEGWAHYTEQMMIENGFGAGSGKDVTLKAAKYHLAQLDEALLRLCRMCVSIQMHCRGMTVEQATRFFQDNCYYEEKPAKAEAVRGAYDPEYLYYTLGKLQFLKLREDYRRQEGDRFSLKQFHDEVLAYGAPPLRLLRERLLKDPAAWAKSL